jgi:hypothetical protein
MTLCEIAGYAARTSGPRTPAGLKADSQSPGLQRPTPRHELTVGDEQAGGFDERFVDVGSPFPADA